MTSHRSIPLILSVIFLIFTAGCSTMRRTSSQVPTTISNHITPTIVLAGPDEPSQRLLLIGTVIDNQTHHPIPGAQVYLYHADANGEYIPTDPADESTAKLSGQITTSANGEFIVDTIVPREYDQPGNRHIHLHYVRAEGYQDGGGVILFEQDVNDEVRQWANQTGFGIIIELEERDGVQHGSIVIELAAAE